MLTEEGTEHNKKEERKNIMDNPYNQNMYDLDEEEHKIDSLERVGDENVLEEAQIS